ncbi:glycosyltransferase family 2 protein [bacterium]|nr:glycosyltransferase family 2 protein [bacterium]
MKQPDLSIVVPCHNEEENVPEFVSRTRAVVEKLGLTHEIILVNDGSRDRTLEVALGQMETCPQLRVIDFSRNFGHQAAVTAGIDLARGKAVILIDADLQDPPEVIEQMVQEWRAGNDLVYCQRRKREGETAFKLITAKAFYRFLNFMSNTRIPEDTGDFRLMDRKVVESLKGMREHHRFIRGMACWVGYRQKALLYDRKARHAGTTNYPFRKMLAFSIDAITSFSVKPLRILSYMGIGIVTISLLMTLIVVAVKLLFPHYFIPGFPVIVILIMFLGGLQIFATGIIGEYIGRIYEEAKGRPLYLINQVYAKPDKPEDK